jgi:two-component system response regulator DesR
VSVEAGPKPIRVLLVKDMDLLRDALVTLLSVQDDIEVVADLRSGDNVVQVASRLCPHLAVVDIDEVGGCGMAKVSELRASVPQCGVIALTVAKPAGLLQRLLEAEVSGVVDKNAPSGLLLQAIRDVAGGAQVVDANLAVAALAVGANPFTPRELQVLRLAADGASGPEIASELSLSDGTVRNYLSKVMSKTRARNRVDAIRIVRDAGWL